MLVNNSLGFSLPSTLTQVAKSAYNVASDPRVQASAAVVGTQFAPDKTAEVQQYARSVSRNIRQARQAFDPNYGANMMPMPPPDGYDGGGGNMPVQHSNMLVYAGIGAGALVLFLLLRK